MADRASDRAIIAGHYPVAVERGASAPALDYMPSVAMAPVQTGDALAHSGLCLAFPNVEFCTSRVSNPNGN
jgi:hypothetical protein